MLKRTLFISLLSIWACVPKTHSVLVATDTDLELRTNDIMHNCNDPLYYVPDSLTTFKYIRLNVHFMDDSKGDKNFSLEEGRQYMKALIDNANFRLGENHKMNLPPGNSTPALEPRYRYKIVGAGLSDDDDGFYKHYDDDLYYFVNKGKYKNNYNRDVIDAYAIGADSIINIFVMPHHPDSLHSSYYKPHRTGIALGTSLKIAGMIEEGSEAWNFATLLNHEIGHILGLSHSWLRHDRCEDTPPHSNCWSQTGTPPCEGVVSNNMMDYNASQMAITPCQLGIVHKGFSKNSSRNRKLVEKNWCTLDASKDIIIDQEVSWYGARDIVHNIDILENGILHIYCRLSLPENARITVYPGGKIILHDATLHNDCGDKWYGIELQTRGELSGELICYGKCKISDTYNDKDNINQTLQ